VRLQLQMGCTKHPLANGLTKMNTIAYRKWESMSNTTTNRGHRPRKNATRITANLNNLAVVEKSSFDRTATIDLALDMLSIVIDAAHAGNPSAIALLSRMGLELSSDEIEPVIVRSSNGDIAAWIV